MTTARPERPSLAGVLAKLDRADEHLAALHEEARAFVGSNTYVFRGKVDTERSRYAIRVEIAQPPPLRLSIVAGDAIHNMRSALDHLITQLVSLNGAEPTNKNAFPILLNPNRGVLKQQLEGVDPTIAGWIEQVQPYNGADEARDSVLGDLRELSNEDKHRVILASHGALSETAEPTLKPVAGQDVQEITGCFITVNKPLKDGDEVLWTDITITGPEPQVDIQGNLTLEIGFGAPLVTLRGSVDIRNALRQLIHGTFEPLFGPR